MKEYELSKSWNRYGQNMGYNTLLLFALFNLSVLSQISLLDSCQLHRLLFIISKDYQNSR